jgi:hypothetical protein
MKLHKTKGLLEFERELRGQTGLQVHQKNSTKRMRDYHLDEAKGAIADFLELEKLLRPDELMIRHRHRLVSEVDAPRYVLLADALACLARSLTWDSKELAEENAALAALAKQRKRGTS